MTLTECAQLAHESEDLAGDSQAHHHESLFRRNVAYQDAQGRRYLLEHPVYICPSLDDIGAGNKPICFGNVQRFIARSAGSEQVVNKYVEHSW